MKVIVLVILSLLISCGPPIQYKDSILNYKGSVVVSKTICIDHYTFKIRMYNKKINDTRLKLFVCDGGRLQSR